MTQLITKTCKIGEYEYCVSSVSNKLVSVKPCSIGNENNAMVDDFEDSLINDVIRQLIAYHNGQLRQFNVTLMFHGTPFQQRVWHELMKIPYGQTCTYKQVAERLGNPNAVRAVAQAIGKNPIHIIVPCHRVVGVNGQLTGYAGGLPLKQYLLDLENNLS